MVKGNKNRVAYIRMTDRDYSLFKAKSRGNMSKWLRAAALESARTNGPHVHDDLLNIWRELVAQGVNLNQIAKKLNSGGNAYGLDEAIQQNRELRDVVMTALSKVK